MPSGDPGAAFLSDAPHVLNTKFTIAHATFQIGVAENTTCDFEADDVFGRCLIATRGAPSPADPSRTSPYGLFLGSTGGKSVYMSDMLKRLLRYLVTSTVLLTMAVAGLPVIVCVSEAHGAMIEVGQMHLDDSKPSANHHALFGQVEKSAQSQPCSDFQLERGTIAKQSREQQPSSRIAPSGGAPFVVSAPLSLRTTSPVPVTVRTFARTFPSSLRERRTIVLLI